jgi:thiol-disulfide isomerase/thioredoxin
MTRKSKNIIVAFVVVVLVITIGVFLVVSRNGSDKDSSTIEQPASNNQSQEVNVSGEFVRGEITPDVTFSDFEGNSYNLTDFRGKAVVLDFWAGWCPFCVNEMPELQAAQDEYGDDLVMIGVHRTDTEDLEDGLEFADERGVTYLLVSDDGTMYRAAGGFGMPVAVYIDKDGVVTEIKSGPKTKKEIVEKVGNLL